MRPYIITLPQFMIPHKINEIFKNIKEHELDYQKFIVVSFANVKSIDVITFKTILQNLNALKLVGKKVAICEIPPHIAMFIASINIKFDIPVFQNANDIK
jgi:anti-anti-sigma regulatory factor